MGFLRRILGRGDATPAPSAGPEPAADPEAAARARAAAMFADEWNPEPDELRAWAFSDAAAPSPDFELGVCGRLPASFLAELAADARCPKQAFFVRCLYLRVWDALRGGARLPEQRAEASSILAAVPDMPDGPLARWREESRRLLDGETPWTPDWADRAQRRRDETAAS